jgi:hypothetical protein
LSSRYPFRCSRHTEISPSESQNFQISKLRTFAMTEPSSRNLSTPWNNGQQRLKKQSKEKTNDQETRSQPRVQLQTGDNELPHSTHSTSSSTSLRLRRSSRSWYSTSRKDQKMLIAQKTTTLSIVHSKNCTPRQRTSSSS